MRIRKGRIKVIAAAVIVAAAPFAATSAVDNMPNLGEVMNTAVKLSGNAYFSVKPVTEFGNGELVLYIPEEDVKQTETVDVEETPPETSELLLSRNITTQSEDLSVFDGQSGNVVNYTYMANPGENFLNLSSGAQVRNCTELENDYVRQEMEIKPSIKIEANSDKPQVLIMHTHTSESYMISSVGYYDSDYTSRTSDSSQNVVAVGEKIAEKLAEAGICVIHDGTYHDEPLYNGSYERSEKTVRAILEEYPSIKIVLDIHRDAIEEDDGTRIAAVTEINGREAAQVMIISAAGGGYYYVPDYIENFHLACLLQDRIESDWCGLTRPVLLDYCQYNQHITTGSLLVEVGSHGNTLEQALYSGELIGKSIAAALLGMSP